MEVLVNITGKELDTLEDYLMVIPLCEKHSSLIDVPDEVQKKCVKCQLIEKTWRGKSLHLWSKLVTAYLKEKEQRKKDKISFKEFSKCFKEMLNTPNSNMKNVSGYWELVKRGEKENE